MNKFEKQLEKWNNGILRGAQSKLAKRLRVSTATVALWTTGQRHPSKGYVAQMAQLFKLDVYDVARLFEHPQMYQPSTGSNLSGLRETEHVDTRHPAHTWPTNNLTVSLPVFSQLPPSYPHYTPLDVQDWWILPQDAAQDAQFLFLLPTPTDPNQLLFIKPNTTWSKGKIMLARHQNNYYVVEISHNKQILRSLQGHLPSKKQLEPVGVVIRKVIKPY